MAFYDDGSVSETHGVNFTVGAYGIWGDRVSFDILDFVGNGTVRVEGETMTIESDDASVESLKGPSRRSDA